jgi:ATPase expression protein 3
VGQNARQIDSMKKVPRTTAASRNSEIVQPSIKVINKSSKTVPKDILKHKQSLQKFQTLRFRDFLSPLGMSNLKIFNDDLPDYDSESATSNWKSRHQQVPNIQYTNFHHDRMSFDRMTDFLISITPPHLKYVSNANLRHVLNQEEVLAKSNQYDDVPKNVFHELPPIPKDLSESSFQKYVYQLTHSTFFYKNSSSLTSGIIPDILLYTHKLTNEKFKPFRTVHTFNYLIKYFGYTKNQSSFARELILVMIKDGHKPNIDTINTLLKTCQIHSHIRNNTNTYLVIMKYLRLCQQFEIEINLMTYVRIYDCINNIFLREVFLNKIQAIGLPILKPQLLRIIDDFLMTTKDTSEVIKFIETDLARPTWYEENVLANKVIHHRGLHVRCQQDAINLWTFITNRIVKYDEFTLKELFDSLTKNNILQSKFYFMFKIYLECDLSNGNNIRLYQFLVKQLLEEMDDIYIEGTGFLLKGIFYEITKQFELPLEVVQYSSNKKSFNEIFAIVNRIFGNQVVTAIDSKLKYLKLPSLSSPIDINQWTEFKQLLQKLPLEIKPIEYLCELKSFKPNNTKVPLSEVCRYQQSVNHKISNLRNQTRIQKSVQGINEFTLNSMAERGLN